MEHIGTMFQLKWEIHLVVLPFSDHRLSLSQCLPSDRSNIRTAPHTILMLAALRRRESFSLLFPLFPKTLIHFHLQVTGLPSEDC